MTELLTTTLRNRMIAALAFGALAFSAALPAQELPTEATPEVVEDCEHVGTVHGHSGYGKHGGIHWEHIAKGRALRKADNAGASHIVWESGHARGAFNGHVYGNMYDCE